MDDILKTLLGMGPGGLLAAFMTFQWKTERDERRELGAANMQLLKDSIVSQHAMADSMDKLAERMK